jgi:hypothetical protein
VYVVVLAERCHINPVNRSNTVPAMDVSYIAGLGRPEDAGLGITHVVPKTLASIAWGSASETGLGLPSPAASDAGDDASIELLAVSGELLQAAAPMIVSVPANRARRLQFLIVIECASVGLMCPSVSDNRHQKELLLFRGIRRRDWYAGPAQPHERSP